MFKKRREKCWIISAESEKLGDAIGQWRCSLNWWGPRDPHPQMVILGIAAGENRGSLRSQEFPRLGPDTANWRLATGNWQVTSDNWQGWQVYPPCTARPTPTPTLGSAANGSESLSQSLRGSARVICPDNRRPGKVPPWRWTVPSLAVSGTCTQQHPIPEITREGLCVQPTTTRIGYTGYTRSYVPVILYICTHLSLYTPSHPCQRYLVILNYWKNSKKVKKV